MAKITAAINNAKYNSSLRDNSRNQQLKSAAYKSNLLKADEALKTRLGKKGASSQIERDTSTKSQIHKATDAQFKLDKVQARAGAEAQLKLVDAQNQRFNAIKKTNNLMQSSSAMERKQAREGLATKNQEARVLATQQRQQAAFARQKERASFAGRTKHAIQNDLSYGAANAILYTPVSIAKGIFAAGKERSKEREIQYQAGYTPEQMKEISKAAEENTSKNPIISQTRAEAMIRHAIASTGDVKHGIELSKTMSDFNAINTAKVGADQAERDSLTTGKVIEDMNWGNKPDKIKSYLEGAAKALQAEGSTLKAEDFYSMVKNLGAAKQNMSPEALTKFGAVLSQTEGGSRTGAQLLALTKQTTGTAQKKAKQYVQGTSFGAEDGSLGYSRNIVKDIGNSELTKFIERTDKFLSQKKIDKNDKQAVNEAFFRAFSNNRAAQAASAIYNNREAISRSEKRFDAARGLSAAPGLTERDVGAAEEHLKASLSDLGAKAFDPLKAKVIKLTNAAADGAKVLSKGDNVFKAAVGVVAGGALVAGAYAAQRVVEHPEVAALSLAGINLSGAAGALSAAAIRLGAAGSLGAAGNLGGLGGSAAKGSFFGKPKPIKKVGVMKGAIAAAIVGEGVTAWLDYMDNEERKKNPAVYDAKAGLAEKRGNLQDTANTYDRLVTEQKALLANIGTGKFDVEKLRTVQADMAAMIDEYNSIKKQMAELSKTITGSGPQKKFPKSTIPIPKFGLNNPRKQFADPLGDRKKTIEAGKLNSGERGRGSINESAGARTKAINDNEAASAKKIADFERKKKERERGTIAKTTNETASAISWIGDRFKKVVGGDVKYVDRFPEASIHTAQNQKSGSPGTYTSGSAPKPNALTGSLGGQFGLSGAKPIVPDSFTSDAGKLASSFTIFGATTTSLSGILNSIPEKLSAAGSAFGSTAAGLLQNGTPFGSSAAAAFNASARAPAASAAPSNTGTNAVGGR